MKVHIFDAISRDQRVIRATEDEIELEYVNLDESDSDGDWRKKKRSVENTQGREMIIHLFGMTAEGESVRVDVTGFRPFFYVAVPPEVDWQSISKKLSTKMKQDFNQIDFKLEHKQKLYGYSGNKKCAFVRISMPSLGMFYTVRKEFLDDKQNPKFVLNARGKPLEVFESNIDPMLRFFHMRDIKPCGWVEVDGDETEAEEGISLRCKWQNVSPAESSAVTAPLLHAFWDIECYSHSGEFPIALPKAKKACASVAECSKVKSIMDKCAACKANDGDPIIQIGTTLWSHGGILEKHIFVLDTCRNENV
jgi:DNA polymerase elongation subunit (family B)